MSAAMGAGTIQDVTASGPIGRQQDGLEALVAGIARGDQRALERLYEQSISRVFGLALRITRQHATAEEVAEDVFIQIWNTAASYNPSRGTIMGWIMTICRSRALDALRRADSALLHPDPEELIVEDPGRGGGLQDLLEATQDHQILHAALARLTAEQRQLLSLAFFRGMTHQEIVAHTGLPLGTVKSNLRRALQVLRRRLETHYG